MARPIIRCAAKLNPEPAVRPFAFCAVEPPKFRLLSTLLIEAASTAFFHLLSLLFYYNTHEPLELGLKLSFTILLVDITLVGIAVSATLPENRTETDMLSRLTELR